MGNSVDLKWHVTNEVNDDHFEVEYSQDGGKFHQIGSVRAINGDKNSYHYTHSTPSLDKVNYYRIKQVDKDGRFTHSEIRTVKFSSENTITVLPNPATNVVRVYAQQSKITVSLFDAGGRKLTSKMITNGNAEFNVSRLPRGTYLVVAERDGVRVESKKIVKQ
jgi:hypothetical protein